MAYILELNQVCKRFPQSEHGLDHVSFSLPYGSIMGLVGENGAGKTTTIGCILNTLAKDSGEIRIFGEPLRDSSIAAKERIGVVYDGDNFPGYLTPRELCRVMSGLYPNWDTPLFHSYLKRFGLPEEQKIKGYSRGMTMELAISAALAHHPELLILDEATGGLDPIVRDDILDLFLEFVEDEHHAILLSSHITSDLEKVADYITFLHRGKVLMTVSRNDLVYRYAVLRCRESQFRSLDPKDILAYRKGDYQIDVLVPDGKAAQKKYRDIVADHLSIDEMMLLLIKGEHR